MLTTGLLVVLAVLGAVHAIGFAWDQVSPVRANYSGTLIVLGALAGLALLVEG